LDQQRRESFKIKEKDDARDAYAWPCVLLPLADNGRPAARLRLQFVTLGSEERPNGGGSEEAAAAVAVAVVAHLCLLALVRPFRWIMHGEGVVATHAC
jgi:hypothetical protein